jgi:hypothetical protein
MANDGTHSCRTGMKVQMNPLNYLHLAHPRVDVRGSQIGVYFLHNKHSKLSTTIVINFQDGRWSKVIEEPITRTTECLKDSRSKFGQDPFFIHSIYLTTALRWWNNALQSFNDQLIAYVSRIFGIQSHNHLSKPSLYGDYLSNKWSQEEALLGEEETTRASEDMTSGLNRALRCILAHLHRYESELSLLNETVQDICAYHAEFHRSYLPQGSDETDATLAKGFEQIASQVASIVHFRDEMQHKADNVLALVSST